MVGTPTAATTPIASHDAHRDQIGVAGLRDLGFDEGEGGFPATAVGTEYPNGSGWFYKGKSICKWLI